MKTTTHNPIAAALLAVVALASLATSAGKAAEPQAMDEKAVGQAAELFPKLLEKRKHLDELLAQYKQCRSAVGTTERRDAERQIPRLRSEIERYLERFARECESLTKPLEYRLTPLQGKLERLQERIDRFAESGRSAKREEEQAAVLSMEIEPIEIKLEILEQMGEIGETLDDPQHTHLYQVIKPDRYEETALEMIMRDHPHFAEARMEAEDVKADIARLTPPAKEGEAPPRPNKRDLERLEEQLEKAKSDLEQQAEYFRRDPTRELERKQRELEQVKKRLERAGEGWSADQYRKDAYDLSSQIDSIKELLKVADRLACLDPPKEAKKAEAAEGEKKEGEGDVDEKAVKEEEGDANGRHGGGRPKPERPKFERRKTERTKPERPKLERLRPEEE